MLWTGQAVFKNKPGRFSFRRIRSLGVDPYLADLPNPTIKCGSVEMKRAVLPTIAFLSLVALGMAVRWASGVVGLPLAGDLARR
jgi:hypothetical protein